MKKTMWQGLCSSLLIVCSILTVLVLFAFMLFLFLFCLPILFLVGGRVLIIASLPVQFLLNVPFFLLLNCLFEKRAANRHISYRQYVLSTVGIPFAMSLGYWGLVEFGLHTGRFTGFLGGNMELLLSVTLILCFGTTSVWRGIELIRTVYKRKRLGSGQFT